MEKKGKKVLTAEVAATIAASFDNKAEMSKYFPTWGKKDANPSYIVGWCNDQIKEVQTMLSNLTLTRNVYAAKNYADVPTDVLEQMLQQRKAAAEVVAE